MLYSRYLQGSRNSVFLIAFGTLTPVLNGLVGGLFGSLLGFTMGFDEKTFFVWLEKVFNQF